MSAISGNSRVAWSSGGVMSADMSVQIMREGHKKRARTKATKGATATGGEELAKKKKVKKVTTTVKHSNRSPPLPPVMSTESVSLLSSLLVTAKGQRQQCNATVAMTTSAAGPMSTSSGSPTPNSGAVASAHSSVPITEHLRDDARTTPAVGCHQTPSHLQQSSSAGSRGRPSPNDASPSSCASSPSLASSLDPSSVAPTADVGVATSSLDLDELLQSSSTEVSMEAVQLLKATYHKKSLETFDKEFVTWGSLSSRAPVLYAVDKLFTELKTKGGNEIGKTIIRKWRDLSPHMKAPYVAKAKENKMRRCTVVCPPAAIATTPQCVATAHVPTTPITTMETAPIVMTATPSVTTPTSIVTSMLLSSDEDNVGDHAHWDICQLTPSPHIGSSEELPNICSEVDKQIESMAQTLGIIPPQTPAASNEQSGPFSNCNNRGLGSGLRSYSSPIRPTALPLATPTGPNVASLSSVAMTTAGNGPFINSQGPASNSSRLVQGSTPPISYNPNPNPISQLPTHFAQVPLCFRHPSLRPVPPDDTVPPGPHQRYLATDIAMPTKSPASSIGSAAQIGPSVIPGTSPPSTLAPPPPPPPPQSAASNPSPAMAAASAYSTAQPWSPVTPTTIVSVPHSPLTAAALGWFDACSTAAPTTAHPSTPLSTHTQLLPPPTTPLSLPTTPLSLSTTPLSPPTMPLSLPTMPQFLPTMPPSLPTMPLSLPTMPLHPPAGTQLSSSGVTCSTPSPSTWQMSKDLLLMLSSYASSQQVTVAQRNTALELLSAILPSFMSPTQSAVDSSPPQPYCVPPQPYCVPPAVPSTPDLTSPCVGSNLFSASSFIGGHSHIYTGVQLAQNSKVTPSTYVSAGVPSVRVAPVRVAPVHTCSYAQVASDIPTRPPPNFSAEVSSPTSSMAVSSGFSKGVLPGVSAEFPSCTTSVTYHVPPSVSSQYNRSNGKELHPLLAAVSPGVALHPSSSHDRYSPLPPGLAAPCPASPAATGTSPAAAIRSDVASRQGADTVGSMSSSRLSSPSPPVSTTKPSSSPMPSRVSPSAPNLSTPFPSTSWPVSAVSERPVSATNPAVPQVLAAAASVPASPTPSQSSNKVAPFHSVASALPTWVSSPVPAAEAPSSPVSMPPPPASTCNSGGGGGTSFGSGGNLTSGSGGNLTSGSGRNLTSGSGGNLTSGSGGNLTSGSGGNLTLGYEGNLSSGSGGRLTSGSGRNLTLGPRGRPSHLSVSPSTSSEGAMSAEHKKEVLRFVQELNRNRASKSTGGSLKSPGGSLKSPGHWEELKSPFHKDTLSPGLGEEPLFPGHWDGLGSSFHKVLKSPCHKEALKSPCHKELLESPCHKEALKSPCQKELLESPCQTEVLKSPCHGAESLKNTTKVKVQNEPHPNFGSHPDFGSPLGLFSSPSPVQLPDIWSPSPGGRTDPQELQCKRQLPASALPPLVTKRARLVSEDGCLNPSPSECITSPSAFKWPPAGQVIDLSHLSVGEIEHMYRENARMLERQRFLAKVIEQQLFKAKHGREVYRRQLKHLVQPEVVFEEPPGWILECSGGAGSRTNLVGGKGEPSMRPEDDVYTGL